MSKTEVTLEMSDAEISHLKRLIQVDTETHAEYCHGPNASHRPAAVMLRDASGSITISTLMSTQAVDLSASTDDQSLMPGFRSAAKVCLDKRFRTMSPETRRQQDVPSSRLSSCWTVLEQTSEAFDGVLHPHVQKFMGTGRSNGAEGVIFNPVTNLSDNVISHAPQVAGSAHQRFSCKSQPYAGAVVQFHKSTSNLTEEQHLAHKENIVPIPAAAYGEHCDTHNFTSSVTTKMSPRVSNKQRREKHNLKERERRKKIRCCCDELNLLVPFCQPGSDKVTTLMWTTAFLRYMNETYGDTFKEEFEKTATDNTGLVLSLSSSFAQNSEQPNLSLTAEQ
ncbi:uncharacterized protein LOC142898833 isoform X2 [Nelusetta ayraudi]|uniref:uncharacterized protein LOC142898833 isoform X2 n=1 Tax=Nelusetta ayraudi TaxID=303726 RepID=UPI003F70540C